MTTLQICSKLDQIWMAKIKEKGLIKTGKMYHSVQWIEDSTGLQMKAEDYYLYLDEKYRVSKEILASKEFKDLIATYYAQRLETNLKISTELKTIIK